MRQIFTLICVASAALASPLAFGQSWTPSKPVRIVFHGLIEPRADVIVGLDYPRWLSLARLLRRTLRRVITQEEVCNGNTENCRAIFSKESIIAWHFKSFRKKKAAMKAWAARPDGTPILLLTHPRELDRALHALASPRIDL